MGRRKKMQTRTITVDYARPRGYDVGYRAENNFTMLALPIPAELKDADSYRVYFESTVGEYLQTELLTPADGYVTVKITSDIVPEPGNMAAQLVAFADGEIVGYAPMITGSAKVSIPDGTERLSHSLAAEIALNTAARHGHANKSVLDKFAESKDGKPTYNGQALGGGGGGSTETELFVVNVQAQSEEGEYTITSHDKTYTQIDEAYKAGKQVLVVCTITGEDSTFLLPLIWATETDYEFSIFVGAVMSIFVDTTDKWTISQDYLEASSIMAKISDDALAESSSLQSILNYKVYPAVEKAHEHDNKSILDLISAVDGKLRYNGSDVGLKGEKGDKGEPGTPGAPGAPGSDATVTKANVVAALGYTPQAVSAQVTAGTEITLADNTEYRLTDVTTLTLTYPTGNFECWLKLSFAASGSVTVTLPTGTKYIGNAPSFANGETWEMSIKDGVVIAQKVGDGT